MLNKIIKTLEVRWSDVDSFNHVSNNVYFAYFDEARLDWLRQFDLGEATSKVGPAILETNCKFLKQLSYPNSILITTEIIEYSKAYFICQHELWDINFTQKYAEGTAKLIWLEYYSQKIVKLPSVLLEHLNNEKIY